MDRYRKQTIYYFRPNQKIEIIPSRPPPRPYRQLKSAPEEQKLFALPTLSSITQTSSAQPIQQARNPCIHPLHLISGKSRQTAQIERGKDPIHLGHLR